MRGEDKTGNIDHTARLALLIALTVLTVVLIVENLLLGWEGWMLPVLGVGIVAAWAVMIFNNLPGETMTTLFSAMLMLETFYYGVHSANLFRIAPVAIVAVMLYALTMRRRLFLCGVAVGYLTTLFRLIGDIVNGHFDFGAENVFITTSHMALLAFAAFVCLRFMRLLETMQSGHEDQMARLDEEREKINDFLTNVSHEIRTPVNAVVGLSRLLERRDLADDLRRDVVSVQSAGLRIADELDDILDYTEVDMEKAVTACEPYMLSSTVNDVLSELKNDMKKDVELIVDVDPAIPNVLMGDRAKLKRVMRHLIANGIKFTETGCVVARLYGVARDYGVNLCLRVSDTGPGIDADILEHLSERFYKGSSGRARSTGGLGLGLPIVTGFVRLMGGFVRIERGESGGTDILVSIPQRVSDAAPCMSLGGAQGVRAAGCFNFHKIDHPQAREAYRRMFLNTAARLGAEAVLIDGPQALSATLDAGTLTHLVLDAESYDAQREAVERFAVRGAVVVVAGDDWTLPGHSRAHVLRKPVCTFQAVSLLNASGTEEQGPSEKVAFPGVRTLIVDDEPTNLIVAEGLLSGYGMEIDTALSGAEAIEMYRAQPFDLVFMDHMMPGMDGVEAARRLRALEREKGRDLYIVALTANTVSGAKAMFRQEGFDGFVAKPIDVQELDRTLRTVLPRAIVVKSGDDAHEEAPVRTLYEALEAAGVDAGVGLGYCGNSASLYEEVLAQFAASGEARLSALEEGFANGDWTNYAIGVHAVKSTAKMIGAENVSRQAAFLEASAKGERTADIEARHRAFMADYTALIQALHTLMPAEDKTGPGSGAAPFDPQTAMALLRELEGALDDFDADRADDALKALEACHIADGAIAGLLRQLRGQVDAFDLKGAGETARAVLARLEGGTGA